MADDDFVVGAGNFATLDCVDFVVSEDGCTCEKDFEKLFVPVFERPIDASVGSVLC